MLIVLRRPVLWATAAVIAVPGAWRSARPPVTLPARDGTTIDTVILKGLSWRSVGPPRGGRSIAISGVRGRPAEGYFGATGGGLWKTVDSGKTWAPVTDGQIHSASVGAVAVSESNPDVVFIGMGESCIRGNVMAGDGVYKSTDAGKTWTHVWGHDQQTISKIRIHPTNPNIVFVAAFGHYSAPNEERGVFKSTDGGSTWRRVLFRDNKTAAIDISIDRTNPQVMYAALWEAWRKEYSMSSGGPGSGLFKSTDGGESWTEITRNPGLPAGVIGKIGVSVSGAEPSRVYAVVENANGGLFRSDDAGATWSLANSDRNIRQRAFYYTHVTADPHNKDLVYVQNVSMYRSTDGGKTLTSYAGGDTHDMWIDPDDSKHLLNANDGGGAVTYDALGAHLFSSREYPTSQFYHIVATAHIPYHICGAQQDASTVCVPSSGGGGRGGGRGGAAPTTYSAGGAEPGYIAPDPRDPDVFYAGGNNGSFLTRLDRRTGEQREVGPYPRMFSGEPASALVERWQWTFPIVFSPVDPSVLYASSQHVWKTTNGGQRWERISPDLTRHDPTTMGMSGGPITHDMNGPEVYAVVFALGPSRRDAKVLWAGSDDGLIHVTRNGGKSWSNVTPKEMPDFGRVSIIDAGAFDAGTAYAAVKRPLLDDVAPYIFRTHDFGRSWTKIVTGLSPTDYVHVVREDPTRAGLLYAGTQHGVYLSYDDGDHWQSLSLNLPDVPVSDLIVEDNSLAIATHGRSFYILDNIQPLRQYTPALSATAEPHLFAPVPAIRGAGGARIEYWLKHPAQRLTIEILAKGEVIRTFTGSAAVAAAGGGRGGAGGGGGRGGGGQQGASMAAGLNGVTWDLRYPAATTFPGMILWGASTSGPAAVPGDYTVRLTADGLTQSQPLAVVAHPRHANVTQADLQEQFDLALQIRDRVSEANTAVIQIRAIKQQVADRLAKSPDATLKARGDTVVRSLSAVEEEIYQVRNQSGQDPLNFPIKINNRLASLLGVVSGADAKPIANAYPIFKDLVAELKVQTDRLQRVLASDVISFNREAQQLGLEPVKLQ